MSIVIGSVSSKIVVMSADKRAVNVDRTFQEDFSKIFKVNNNVLIGFTGSGTVPEILNKNGFFKRNNNIKPSEYAAEIFSVLGKGQVNKESNIMILGKETPVDAYFGLFTTASLKMDIEKIISDDNILNFVMPPVEFSGKQDEINSSFRSKIVDLINSDNLSLTSIIKEHRELIEVISEKAESVNNNCETLII